MENASKYKQAFNDELSLLMEKGSIEGKYRLIIETFYAEYLEAVSPDPELMKKADEMFRFFLLLLFKQVIDPITFEPYHQKVLSPLNYYQFGLDFMRLLVAQDSFIKGEETIKKIKAQLQAKENVVFLANHQIEADPIVLNILLEKSAPELGKEMIFVAGERVITDPLAVPFSLGRNLLCIYSKRYIDQPPEDKLKKQLHNKKTMEKMSELFDEGGKSIYVAPSGGRDRKNSLGVIEVAPFDPQSIEMFNLMAKKAKKKTHFYPLALNTYDMLPPPETIQRELGEMRKARRSRISAGFLDEIDMEKIVSSMHTNKHELRRLRAEAIWKLVSNEFEALRSM